MNNITEITTDNIKLAKKCFKKVRSGKSFKFYGEEYLVNSIEQNNYALIGQKTFWKIKLLHVVRCDHE